MKKKKKKKATSNLERTFWWVRGENTLSLLFIFLPLHSTKHTPKNFPSYFLFKVTSKQTHLICLVMRGWTKETLIREPFIAKVALAALLWSLGPDGTIAEVCSGRGSKNLCQRFKWRSIVSL